MSVTLVLPLTCGIIIAVNVGESRLSSLSSLASAGLITLPPESFVSVISRSAEVGVKLSSSVFTLLRSLLFVGIVVICVFPAAIN